MFSYIAKVSRSHLVEKLHGEELDRFNAVYLHMVEQREILSLSFAVIGGGFAAFVCGITQTYTDIDIFVRKDVVGIPEDLLSQSGVNEADGSLVKVIDHNVLIDGVDRKVQLCLIQDRSSNNQVDFALKVILRFDIPACRVAVFLQNGVPCKISYTVGQMIISNFHRYYPKSKDHHMRRVEKYKQRNPICNPPSLKLQSYKNKFLQNDVQ